MNRWGEFAPIKLNFSERIIENAKLNEDGRVGNFVE